MGSSFRGSADFDHLLFARVLLDINTPSPKGDWFNVWKAVCCQAEGLGGLSVLASLT